MQEEATRHVKEKLANGILKFSQGPYRSRYFLVAKKIPGEKEIHQRRPTSEQKVTIRDSGMPPLVDEFSKDFAEYPILSSID
jgi:hypothetical protein